MADHNSALSVEDSEQREVETPYKEPKKSKLLDGFRSMFVWYPKNYSSEERKLLFKLDISILIYASTSYFARTLDTKNVSNAYVSGMKEDLGMYGNELNWLIVVHQMGYVFGQIPGLLLLSRPRFSRWVLPTLEVTYGVLTLLQSTIKTTNHLYAIRFFVGLAEAPTYAGIHYTLGKWYSSRPFRGNPPELFVRSATFFLSLSAGNLISGHLQAAAYTNLDGVHGHTGWQWLFLIDGVFTLGLSILGFVLWTGIPEAGKPFLLTDKEYKLVFTRLKRFDIKEARPLNLDTLKRTFGDWKWYLFCFNYTIMCLVWYPISYFSLWLKAQGTYSVPEINRYPTICDAIGVVVSFVGTSLAAVYPHWLLYTIGTAGPLIGAIIMCVYYVSDAAVFAAFYISYFINMTSPILYAYVNVILREDSEQKAIVLGSMMTFAQFTYVWLAFALFPTSAKNPARAAPQWNIGWPVSAGLAGLMIITYGLITFLHEREKKRGTAFENPDYEDELLDLSKENVDLESLNEGSVSAKKNVRHNVSEVDHSD